MLSHQIPAPNNVRQPIDHHSFAGQPPERPRRGHAHTRIGVQQYLSQLWNLVLPTQPLDQTPE